MWQISWMLGWLPEWFWQAALGFAVVVLIAAKFLKLVPLINTYRIPLNIGGIVLAVVSIWFLGGAANEEKWQRRVAELEEKVRVAEEQSRNANKEVEEKIVYRDKVIKEKGREVVRYIDRWNTREVLKEVQGPERVRIEEVIKYIETCPVPPELLQDHNRAITDLKAASQVKRESEDKK